MTEEKAISDEDQNRLISKYSDNKKEFQKEISSILNSKPDLFKFKDDGPLSVEQFDSYLGNGIKTELSNCIFNHIKAQNKNENDKITQVQIVRYLNRKKLFKQKEEKYDPEWLFNQLKKKDLRELDDNENLRLELNELEDHFPEVDPKIIEIIFNKIDLNHDGQIDAMEFFRWRGNFTKKDLNKLFKDYIKNQEEKKEENKTEEPPKEEPKTEEPPKEEPKEEPPKEEPKTEEPPKEDAPKEEPKTEEPKYEEPPKEEPKTEEPPKEEPPKEEPKEEPPKTEEPPKEEPPKEEPPKEETKTEEPPKEEPKTEEPPKEEPKYEEPPKEEPPKEEPPKEEPKTEEPPKEEPKTEEPKYVEPPKEEPKKEEPPKEEPKTEEPPKEEPKKVVKKPSDPPRKVEEPTKVEAPKKQEKKEEKKEESKKSTKKEDEEPIVRKKTITLSKVRSVDNNSSNNPNLNKQKSSGSKKNSRKRVWVQSEKTKKWRECKVLKETKEKYYIHFISFHKKYDKWIEKNSPLLDEERTVDELEIGDNMSVWSPEKKQWVEGEIKDIDEKNYDLTVTYLGTKKTAKFHASSNLFSICHKSKNEPGPKNAKVNYI